MPHRPPKPDKSKVHPVSRAQFARRVADAPVPWWLPRPERSVDRLLLALSSSPEEPNPFRAGNRIILNEETEKVYTVESVRGDEITVVRNAKA